MFPFRNYTVRFSVTGQGPPVICLHNGGTSSTIWRCLYPILAAEYQVYALDLPGFGSSIPPEEGLCLKDHVDLLEAFVREKKLSPVYLLGNCMGSAIALLFAQRNITTCRKIILFNPLSLTTFEKGGLRIFLHLRRYTPGLMEHLIPPVSKFLKLGIVLKICLRFHFGDMGSRSDLRKDLALKKCYQRPTQLKALYHVLKDLENYSQLDQLDPSPSLRDILCVIWGEQNLVLSARAGEELNQKLKPARQIFLANCGHLPMLEDPTTCLEIIQSFLKSPTS